MKFTVVVDNNVPPGAKAAFRGEHGLSVLIETGANKILFDAGPSDIVVYNLGLLGVHPRELDAIVLSHGHYDHTGGLPSVLAMAGKKIPVFSHPDIFTKRYSVAANNCRYVGVPFTREHLVHLGADFRSVEEPLELVPNLWISGPVPREIVRRVVRVVLRVHGHSPEMRTFCESPNASAPETTMRSPSFAPARISTALRLLAPVRIARLTALLPSMT